MNLCALAIHEFHQSNYTINYHPKKQSLNTLIQNSTFQHSIAPHISQEIAH